MQTNQYDPKKIESKWQERWEKDGIYNARNNKELPKFYGLIEFPYPSGAGMHVGHIRSNTAMDIICRKRRMEGFNVLYPIGWDAFGLPTENYAIKTGIHPRIVTKQNTDNFRKQLKSLGFSFDWTKEIDTTDPNYYRWTQWIFLQFYKNGLAYKDKMPINWCPSCKIGLANEEAIGGVCERCGGPTEKREKEQWMLAITKYADRLDKDLDDVNYLEKIKIQQKNWIGKSEGHEVNFRVAGTDIDIKVFTTRVDTIFGATYVVLAPESPLVDVLKDKINNFSEVSEYIKECVGKDETERGDAQREKTGVVLDGIFAINPATKKEIPIYIADYVLGHYGTGAVMAVPAHDVRDYAFAQKYSLEIIQAISGGDLSIGAYIGEGKMINSGEFSGMNNIEAKDKISDFVGGRKKTTYKLRDWVFSRQRYWGEPIPVIHCQKCGVVPVPENALPVLLPDVDNYKPTDNGESPLAAISEWVNIKCFNCGGEAKRETDTMPNWAGSSWYFLRYVDSVNDKEFASKEKLAYWTPVDWYNGGMEHTTLHLLYSRFWHKFLFDLGLVPTSEPYNKRTSHGMVLAEGGEKMSKSKGNVVNPDELVDRFGADSLRLFEMFMGPFDQAISWNFDGMVGVRRFLEKVWRLQYKKIEDNAQIDNKLSVLFNQTIKKVGEDIEELKFNTAISQMMILVNELDKMESIGLNEFKTFLIVLAPFAPHLCEELWLAIGQEYSVHNQSWPLFDKTLLQDNFVDVVIQINGKTRGKLSVARGSLKETIIESVLSDPKFSGWTKGSLDKSFYVQDKLLNLLFVS